MISFFPNTTATPMRSPRAADGMAADPYQRRAPAMGDVSQLLKEGCSHLRLGEEGPAETSFTQALGYLAKSGVATKEQEAQRRDALLFRGEARYALGRFSLAQDDFESVDGDPSGRADAGLAMILSQSTAQNSLRRARIHADRAAALSPPRCDTWVDLARVWVDFEEAAPNSPVEVARAERELGHLIEQQPDDARLLLGLSAMYDRRGAFADALESAERARAVSPMDQAALAACAIAGLRGQRAGWQMGVDTALKALVARSPRGFWTLLAKAEQAVDAPARVVEFLTAATQINAYDRTANALLIRAQARLPQPLLTLSPTIDAGHSTGFVLFDMERRAEAALRAGDIGSALQAVGALCLRFNQPQFFAWRAAILATVRPEDDAVAEYCNSALALNQNHHAALFTRGKQHCLLSRFDEAIVDMTQCRKLDSDQPDPWYILAEVAAARGQTSYAIDLYTTYLDESYGSPRHYTQEARLGRAKARLANEMYELALEDASKVDRSAGALHKEAQALYADIMGHKYLKDSGVHPNADLAKVRELFAAGLYDQVLATMHHHIGNNSCNIDALALMAQTYLAQNNIQQALFYAQLAQDTAFMTCVSHPLSARILEEVQAKDTSFLSIFGQGITGVVNWLKK